MRKIIYYTGVFIMGLVISSSGCNPDGVNGLTVTPSSITLSYVDDSATFTVNFFAAWQVMGTIPSWLSLSATSGVCTTDITVTILEPNLDQTPRTYTITLRTPDGDEATVTVTQTFSGHWVTFDPNDGYSGICVTNFPEPQAKGDGATLVLSDLTPKLFGFQFDGWNSSADGSGTSFDPGDNYTTDADVTLYAQWSSMLVMVSAGETHALALMNDGTVWAWGRGDRGELGLGYNPGVTANFTPMQVVNITDVVTISAGGFHSLAIKNDGTVWAWGNNQYGQLGDNSLTRREYPVQVSGLTGMTAIAAGYEYSMALKSDGTVWAWGINVNHGQLGDGTTNNRSTPVQATGLSNVVAIAAGANHSLALDASGNVWAWGANVQGQLGNATDYNISVPHPTPVQVTATGVAAIEAIAAGSNHSLALKDDGTVYSWGAGDRGQLGHTGYLPGQMGSITGVAAIAGEDSSSLVLIDDGNIWGLGNNTNGQLGYSASLDQNNTTPLQAEISGVKAISAGRGTFALAIKNDNTLWSWGNNGWGQLGNSTNAGLSGPNPVPAPVVY